MQICILISTQYGGQILHKLAANESLVGSWTFRQLLFVPCLFLSLAFMLFISVPASRQVAGANLEGTMTDASGAVLAHAKVGETKSSVPAWLILTSLYSRTSTSLRGSAFSSERSSSIF
jgi:hypothetical protein